MQKSTNCTADGIVRSVFDSIALLPGTCPCGAGVLAAFFPPLRGLVPGLTHAGGRAQEVDTFTVTYTVTCTDRGGDRIAQTFTATFAATTGGV